MGLDIDAQPGDQRRMRWQINLFGAAWTATTSGQDRHITAATRAAAVGESVTVRDPREARMCRRVGASERLRCRAWS